MSKEQSNPTIVIGVSGGSGSGKTYFCKELLDKVDADQYTILHADDYFLKKLPKMISPLNGKEYDDWNSLTSLDFTRLHDDMQNAIKSNRAIVVIEGAYIFCYENLRSRMNLKIFIDTDIELRLYRRIKRNMATRNLSMEEIGDYFLEAAKFSEQVNAIPSKIYADLILNGAKDFDLPINIVLNHLNTLL